MDCEINETLAAAKTYLNNLNVVKTELKNAEKQVSTTYDETRKSIVQTFSNLKTYLADLLEKREKALLDECEQIQRQGLLPLKQSIKIVSEKIENTNNLIALGVSISDTNKLEEFLGKASLLGSLPEVPELKEVPCISFHFEPSYRKDFESICSNFGEIYQIAPVQIKTLQAKPGAILVEWQQCIDNEDKFRDIQEFRLQRAFGDVSTNKNLLNNFVDCYIGVETQFLLRDIQISQPYSFRICCKFDGTSEWSPWSVPQVGLTNIKAFSWEESKGFILSNDNKIIQPLNHDSTILYSKGPQVSVEDSVEFTILEVDTTDAIIGLVDRKDSKLGNLHCSKEGSILLDHKGRIFVDGVEKSTVLPKFVKGLKICFSCERLNDSKIRVNVDSSDKRVTYDWPIGEDSKLYFACQLSSSQWKIMVE